MTGQPGRFTGQIPPAWGSGPNTRSCLEHNPAFLTSIQPRDSYYDGKLNVRMKEIEKTLSIEHIPQFNSLDPDFYLNLAPNCTDSQMSVL